MRKAAFCFVFNLGNKALTHRGHPYCILPDQGQYFVSVGRSPLKWAFQTEVVKYSTFILGLLLSVLLKNISYEEKRMICFFFNIRYFGEKESIIRKSLILIIRKLHFSVFTTTAILLNNKENFQLKFWPLHLLSVLSRYFSEHILTVPRNASF